ncbi:MAG TPA: hypothetical protein VMX17_14790 [Candidatus Glassbacteria bacterium]|nr:hypothetical protein [Candidatus Glassbacteria bacterium]
MKKYLVYFGVLLFLISGHLLGTSKNAYAFTDHRFMVNTDPQGEYFIDSFPDEMNNIPKENYPHLLINYCCEKGIWDTRGWLAGEANCSGQKTDAAIEKITAVKKAIDKILPEDYRIISFSYILCYHDVIIYFEEDYTYDQMCEIAEKLNVERRNFNIRM